MDVRIISSRFHSINTLEASVTKAKNLATDTVTNVDGRADYQMRMLREHGYLSVFCVLREAQLRSFATEKGLRLTKKCEYYSKNNSLSAGECGDPFYEKLGLSLLRSGVGHAVLLIPN